MYKFVFIIQLINWCLGLKCQTPNISFKNNTFLFGEKKEKKKSNTHFSPYACMSLVLIIIVFFGYIQYLFYLITPTSTKHILIIWYYLLRINYFSFEVPKLMNILCINYYIVIIGSIAVFLFYLITPWSTKTYFDYLIHYFSFKFSKLMNIWWSRYNIGMDKNMIIYK
jgi:hypothetical protein